MHNLNRTVRKTLQTTLKIKTGKTVNQGHYLLTHILTLSLSVLALEVMDTEAQLLGMSINWTKTN